jgi:hypothetical protein
LFNRAVTASGFPSMISEVPKSRRIVDGLEA